MKKFGASKILCVFLVLLMLAMTGCAFAEEDEYEGNPPISPDLYFAMTEDSGCDWTYTLDDPEVLEVSDEGVVDEGDGSDGGLQHHFRLFGIEEGYTIITFFYGAPNEEPLKKVEIAICVGEYWDVMLSSMYLK